MADLCNHCEYGNRFIDLGKCPECKVGRIVGDLHTRTIFCSKLHHITSISVDFWRPQNCEVLTKNYYEVQFTQTLTSEQLIIVANYFNVNRSQVYNAYKTNTSLGREYSFDNILIVGKYLCQNNIPFQVNPPLPILKKYCECFPNNAENYKWVLTIPNER